MTSTQRAQRYALGLVGLLAGVILGGTGIAVATTPARTAVLSPVPSVQSCQLVPGATADTWTLSCTIVGLVTPPGSPSPSPSTSPTPTPTPSTSPSPSNSPTPTPTPTPTGDRTPPSVPTGLVADVRSPTQIAITWTASTDNVGVIGYEFFRGSTSLGVTPTPDWLDTDLTPDTQYTYKTQAIDAAGNRSAFSATLTTRTAANPPPTPGNQCQADPGKCGFPNAATTGAASGLPSSSKTQFTTAGEKVSNVRLTGCVEVRAANVTFTNVEFAPNTGCFVRVNNFSTGLMIVDSTIACGGSSSNHNAISSGDVTVLRADISGCENGFGISGNNVTVTDSWIHDLVTCCGAHTDGAEIGEGAKNLYFQHNTIIMPPGSTSAIIMWDEGGVQNSNVTVANNLMAGGAYTLYCGRQGAVVNVQILNNRFGTYTYGYADACDSGETWSGNVNDSTGAGIPAT